MYKIKWTNANEERVNRMQRRRSRHMDSLISIRKQPLFFPVSALLSFLAVTFILLSAFNGSDSDLNIENSKKLDSDALLARMDFSKDKTVDMRQGGKGWMLNPLKVQEQFGLSGGATKCDDVHLGQILPGKMRGNHRHNYCNETIILWGAKTRYRLEKPSFPNGYVEVLLSKSDVAVVAGPSGLAHAVINLDRKNTLYLLACQDAVYDTSNPQTDYKVWKDL